MAISSLSKFSIPMDGTNQTLLMPKLKYRFRVTLLGFGATSDAKELTKQVVTVARPQVQFENQTIHVYNSQIKYAGKHTWQPLNLTVRDDVNGQVTKVVGEQLQKQFDFFEQSSASSGSDYKFTTVIEMLDGGNGGHDAIVKETWEVYGCYIQNVNYNEFAYAESTPMEIALTLEFDNALQLAKMGDDTPSGGVGAALVSRGLSSIATGSSRG